MSWSELVTQTRSKLMQPIPLPAPGCPALWGVEKRIKVLTGLKKLQMCSCRCLGTHRRRVVALRAPGPLVQLPWCSGPHLPSLALSRPQAGLAP